MLQYLYRKKLLQIIDSYLQDNNNNIIAFKKEVNSGNSTINKMQCDLLSCNLSNVKISSPEQLIYSHDSCKSKTYYNITKITS